MVGDEDRDDSGERQTHLILIKRDVFPTRSDYYGSLGGQSSSSSRIYGILANRYIWGMSRNPFSLAQMGGETVHPRAEQMSLRIPNHGHNKRSNWPQELQAEPKAEDLF